MDLGLDDLVGDGFSTDDAEAIAQLVKRQPKANKASWYSFQEGSNVLRFLPALKGESSPFVISYQHYLKNWGGGSKALVFNCPREMGGHRCPACEKRDLCLQSDNEADKVRARALKPKIRVYARVIDRKNEEAGVQIVGFPKTVFERLTEIRQNADEYGQDYTHPLEGDDILIVKRKGDNGIWTYTTTVRNRGPQRLAESDDQIRQWLTSAPDLQRQGNVMTYEKISEISAKMIAEAQGRPVQPALTDGGSNSSEFSSSTAEDAVGSSEAIEATTAF